MIPNAYDWQAAHVAASREAAVLQGRDPEVAEAAVCHGCDVELDDANTSVNADTCDECLAHCGCWTCAETRDAIAEDRAEQMTFDASRDRDE